MVEIGQEWSKMVKNGQKRSKMVKMVNMVQNVISNQISPKLTSNNIFKIQVPKIVFDASVPNFQHRLT